MIPNAVAVIDDKLEEGFPIASAFWYDGILVRYYTGQPEYLPEHPLTGIRLLILDMVLGVDPTDPKTVFGKLFIVLNRILSDENGPYVIIVWTKHPELEGIFDELMKLYISDEEPEDGLEEFSEILTELTIPKPAFYLKMQKREYLGNDDSEEESSGNDDSEEESSEKEDQDILTFLNKDTFDLKKLLADIKSKYSELGASIALMDWERCLHDSVNSTMKLISDLASESSKIDKLPFKADELQDKWKLSLERILASIAREFGLRKEKDWKEIRKSVYRGLLPVMIDQFEQSLVDVSENLKESFERVTEVNQNSEREKVFRCAFAGKLNGVLHCDPCRNNKVMPGNVYQYKDILDIFPDFGKKREKESLSQQILMDIFDPNTEGYDIKRFSTESTPIFVEFTPICDYLQHKMKASRLIGGAVIPFDLRDNLKSKTQFMKDFGPISHDDITILHDNVVVVLNSHFITGTKNDILQKITPIFRIRREMLSAFQSWIGSHAGRQGALLVTVPKLRRKS